MIIFPYFSHDVLMSLNIFLALVHIILSTIVLYCITNKIEIPSSYLITFLVVSIIACILILLYSVDCKTRFVHN